MNTMLRRLIQFVMKVGIVMLVKFLELHGTQLRKFQKFALSVTNALLGLRQNVKGVTKIRKGKLRARLVLKGISATQLK